jgi:hypothetical protein
MMHPGTIADDERRDARFYSIFDRMPRTQRLMLLTSAVVSDAFGATNAICALFSLAICMTTRLSAAQKHRVLCHVHNEIALLGATHDDADAAVLN